ncbi:hypothetical protein D3C76_1636240 [compost metagenome]
MQRFIQAVGLGHILDVSRFDGGVLRVLGQRSSRRQMNNDKGDDRNSDQDRNGVKHPLQ